MTKAKKGTSGIKMPRAMEEARTQTREQKLEALLRGSCGFEESRVRTAVAAMVGNGTALGLVTELAEMLIEIRQLEQTAKFNEKQARNLLEQKQHANDTLVAKLEGVKLVLDSQRAMADLGRVPPHPAFFYGRAW